MPLLSKWAQKKPNEAPTKTPHKHYGPADPDSQPGNSSGALGSIRRRAWKKGVSLGHRHNILEVGGWTSSLPQTQLCFVALCDVLSTHPPSIGVDDSPATAGFRLNDVVKIVR